MLLRIRYKEYLDLLLISLSDVTFQVRFMLENQHQTNQFCENTGAHCL